MDELFDQTYSMDTINRIFNLKNLHKQLSGYYRTKSKDRKRINELWKEIDREEALLKLDGVEIG